MQIPVYASYVAKQTATVAEQRGRAWIGEHWQSNLLRDVFGNPFHSVSLDPAWITPLVKGLALSIYDDRNFTDLPILADALEEAGCTNADILQHCRGPGPHVRGCWSLDLILCRK
jgi:hypothetical protein